jgi:hypothetical protein
VTRLRILTILLMTAMLWACSGSQRSGSRPEDLEGGGGERNREAQELRGSCERGAREVTYDLNHDGTTDIREVYSRSGLTCRETDLNFDGRVDVYRYFENGVQRREEMDLDRDGRLDLVSIFDPSGQRVVREEYDTNYDGRIDVWRYFSADEVQRVERDSDHDGQADVWTHCSQGRADRLEYDTNGDGEPDDSQSLREDQALSECSRGELAETDSPEPPAAQDEPSGDEEG